MEGASAEGEAQAWDHIVAPGVAEEEAAPAAEAHQPAAQAARPSAAGGGTRPQDVTERSTPRFLRSLHQARAARRVRRGVAAAFPSQSRWLSCACLAAQALFGLGTRDAAAQPDADDQAFLEQLNDAIGKTETELFKRQAAVPKAPDRTAERYWSQYWLALLHDEEPLTPTVVAMRRTAKERMAFESSKYVNPALGNGKLDLFYAVSGAWPRAAAAQRAARRARRCSAAHCPRTVAWRETLGCDRRCAVTSR